MILLPGKSAKDSGKNLETSGGKPDVDRMKAELRDVQTESNHYFRRMGLSLDWLNSRWEGQTVDGRRWWKYDGAAEPFPWAGSSDTRVRFTKSLVNEYGTLAMYALMNMKIQARSTRPAASIRESAQATNLVNWQLYTSLVDEWHRETQLAVKGSAIFGSSVLAVDWEQERRLDHVPFNVMQLAKWVSMRTGQQLGLMQMQAIMEDTSYEKDLINFIQDLSPILSKAAARSILNDLRTLRTADVPVPYIYRNKPRLMALRPMVDVWFAPEADDLQRTRWVDRIEYVTEAVLTDRIETDGYDQAFVKDAIATKGNYTTDFGYNDAWSRYFDCFNVMRPGNRPANGTNQKEMGLIELHHFNHYSLDMGVPCLYKTVFHMELDDYATSGVSEYQHGQMPFHALRFETDHRPILSSMGIPEITYTWENELKVQFDARTDRASLALAPPMFCNHNDLDKIGTAFKPNALIPTRPGFEPKFADAPRYDPGSIEVSQDVMKRAREYFGWFGIDVDPQLKQMRQMEAIDRVTTQFKSPVAQILMLDQQFMTDQEVEMIVGKLEHPFHVGPQQIRAQHDITMTCDPRELDNAFLKEKFRAIAQIIPWDTTGIIDRTPIVYRALESIDYTLADQAIRDPQEAQQKEISDEMEKMSLIIGSGVEQPLPPENSNFNVRMQTMQQVLNSTPFIKQRVAQQPDVLKIIENRSLYMQRQVQQRANAQIGRIQVGGAFDKGQVPAVAPTGQ